MTADNELKGKIFLLRINFRLHELLGICWLAGWLVFCERHILFLYSIFYHLNLSHPRVLHMQLDS
jgi:hypothetical protein